VNVPLVTADSGIYDVTVIKQRHCCISVYVYPVFEKITLI